jgi:hypothetical protein
MRRRYERRITSLEMALWESRDYLKSRLGQLPNQRSTPEEPGSDGESRAWAADVLLLRMLQHAAPEEHHRSVRRGQALLKDYVDHHPGSTVTWEDLVSNSWVRVIWGHWHLPWEMKREPAEDQDEASVDLFRALLHLREGSQERRRIHVPEATRMLDEHRAAHPATPSVEQLVQGEILMENGGEYFVAPHSTVLRASGDWLAARLWDRTDAGPSGCERLSWWRDRILGLDADWYHFGRFLDTASREQFIDCLWGQLLAEQDLLDWERERYRVAAHWALAHGHGHLDEWLSRTPVPSQQDPVAQMSWLDMVYSHHHQDERSELGALMSIIFRWRSRYRLRTPWYEWMKQLAEASQTRPYFVHAMQHAVLADPSSAADMILVPKTTVIGLVSLGDEIHTTAGTLT